MCGKRQDVRELTNDNVKYLEGIQTIASDGDNVRKEVEEGYDVECCTVGEHHEVFSSRDKSGKNITNFTLVSPFRLLVAEG